MKLSYNLNKTKAVLVGISEYDGNFSSIKPAINNVNKLAHLLADPLVFGLPKKNIIKLINVNNYEITDELYKIKEDNEVETLIFYYVGHGFRMSRQSLYLTAKNSDTAISRVKYTSIAYEDIKFLIERIGKKRVVIIDACYSGIATQSETTALNEVEKVIEGSYIMTSAPKDEQSLYNTDNDYTYFTQELVEVFETGIEDLYDHFSLDDLYEKIDSNLRIKKLPQPQRRDNLNVRNNNFKFAKNRKFNKVIVFAKVEKLYEQGQYLELVKYVSVIRNKYTLTKRVKSLYAKSQDAIKYEELYLKTIDYYNQSDFINALKFGVEAIAAKDDSRNVEIRNIIDDCKIYIEISKRYEGEINKLRLEIAQIVNERETLAKENTNIKKSYEKAVNANKEKETILTQLTTHLDDEKEKNSNLELKNEDLVKELKEIEFLLTRNKTSREKAEKRILELEDRSENLNELIDLNKDLKTKNSNLADENLLRGEELTKRKAELESLSGLNEKLEKELASKNKEIDRIGGVLESETRNLKKEVIDKNSIILELRESVEVLSAKVKDLKKEESFLISKNVQLESRLENAIANLKKKGGGDEQLAKERDLLQRTVIKLEEENKALIGLDKRNEDRITEMTNTISELREQVLPLSIIKKRRSELRTIEEKIRRQKEKATRRK